MAGTARGPRGAVRAGSAALRGGSWPPAMQAPWTLCVLLRGRRRGDMDAPGTAVLGGRRAPAGAELGDSSGAGLTVRPV